MSLDPSLQKQLHAAVSADDRGLALPRLGDDARRLYRRVLSFLDLHLLHREPDREAMELACWALQLPMRATATQGSLLRPPRHSLRERAEAAAEMLVSQIGDALDPALLDRTTRLLREVPVRKPQIEESKLLADALNMEDFGILGLLHAATAAAAQGNGLCNVLEGQQKREAYGYWDARLRDGFHFAPVRARAVQRLQRLRDVIDQLQVEIEEGHPA